MIQSKAKYWNGRKVAEEKIIPAGSGKVEFGALYEATDLLMKEHKRLGWMDGDNPIGFSFSPLSESYGYIPKWHLLTKEDKAKLDGVLVSSNFRNHDVKIIYFEHE